MAVQNIFFIPQYILQMQKFAGRCSGVSLYYGFVNVLKTDFQTAHALGMFLINNMLMEFATRHMGQCIQFALKRLSSVFHSTITLVIFFADFACFSDDRVNILALFTEA